jgi:hypothetical protein
VYETLLVFGGIVVGVVIGVLCAGRRKRYGYRFEVDGIVQEWTFDTKAELAAFAGSVAAEMDRQGVP